MGGNPPLVCPFRADGRRIFLWRVPQQDGLDADGGILAAEGAERAAGDLLVLLAVFGEPGEVGFQTILAVGAEFGGAQELVGFIEAARALEPLGGEADRFRGQQVTSARRSGRRVAGSVTSPRMLGGSVFSCTARAMAG